MDFSPSDIPGLIRAWRPDQGVATDVNGITSVSAAWGTTVGLTASGTTEPDLATGLGPNNQDIFKFTLANAEKFSFTTTGALTTCTLVMVLGPTDFATVMTLFGLSSSLTQFVRINSAAGATATVMTVRMSGGSAVNNTVSSRLNHNMQVLVMTYDASAAGGTTTFYIDGIAQTPVTAVGAGGITFDQLGAMSAATNPFGGYMGPTMIYNRVLTAAEIASLGTFLEPWRGMNLYVANAGNDASETPWNQSTPWQDPNAANIGLSFFLHGDETIALKGGDVFRLSAGAASGIPGQSDSIRITLDGGLWGTGKAQTRGSVAPTLTLASGTVYSCGALANKPSAFTFYIPGGVITFGANYTLGSMQRLTEDTSTPTTPAVGKWGYDTGTLYVNAGVALTTGDIEVCDPTIPARINLQQQFWNCNNVIQTLVSVAGWGPTASNITLNGCEAWFAEDDGFGTTGALTGIVYNDCISLWAGIGEVDTGIPNGDGFSMHDTVSAAFNRCQSWWSGKAGFDHQSTTTTTHDRCFAIGSLPYRAINLGAGGSMSVTNSIGVVPNGTINPDGITNGSADITFTALNNTIYSLSSGAAGKGILQNLAGGSIIAKNNIFVGFAEGINWTSGGTLDAHHNCYFGNAANYVGITAGVGDIPADPQFTDASAFDFTLVPGSACYGTGIGVGTTFDYAGTARQVIPSVGAYEGAPAAPIGGGIVSGSVGGSVPPGDRTRTKEEIAEARERFGIPNTAKEIILAVAAQQAARLEQDKQKQLDELRGELKLRNLEIESGYMEALAAERERLLNAEIATRLTAKLRRQNDEELMLLAMIAAATA